MKNIVLVFMYFLTLILVKNVNTDHIIQLWIIKYLFGIEFNGDNVIKR